jgi:hypothetical protein
LILREELEGGRLTGVKMHAAGTNIEGALGGVLSVVERVIKELHREGAVRLSTEVKLGTRTDKKGSIEGRLESVDARLKEPRAVAMDLRRDSMLSQDGLEDGGGLLIAVPPRVASISGEEQGDGQRRDSSTSNTTSNEANSESSVEIRLTPAGDSSTAIGLPASYPSRRPSAASSFTSTTSNRDDNYPNGSSSTSTTPHASPALAALSAEATPFIPVTFPRRSQSYVNVTAAATSLIEQSASGPTSAMKGSHGRTPSTEIKRRVSLAPGQPGFNPARASPLGPNITHAPNTTGEDSKWRRKSQTELPIEEGSWRRERNPSASSTSSKRRPSGASLSGFGMTPMPSSTLQPPEQFEPGTRRKSLPAGHRGSPAPSLNPAVAQQLHLISEQARALQAQVSALEDGLAPPPTETEPVTYPPGLTSSPGMELFLKHLPRNVSKPALFTTLSTTFPGVRSVTIPFPNRDFGYLEFSSRGGMQGALEKGEVEFEGRKVGVVLKKERGTPRLDATPGIEVNGEAAV